MRKTQNFLRRAGSAALALTLTVSLCQPAFAATKAPFSKDETVYAVMAADGSVTKTTVSEHLYNADGLAGVEDRSTLKNIVNTESFAEYTRNGDTLVWNTDDTDVYYKGDTDRQLPISAKVTYTLDGRTAPLSELLGQSGHLVLTIDLTNNETGKVTVNGKERTIVTPLVTAVGVVLGDDASNVNAVNGLLESAAKSSVAAFVTLPGVKESLDGLLPEQVNGVAEYLQDSVTVEADVENLAAPQIMLAAATSPDALGTDNVFDLDSINELTDGIQQLNDAMSQLMDGASQLEDGVSQLADGTLALLDGASQLNTGAAALNDGLGQLTNGLDTLTSNNDALNSAAQQVADGVLASANSSLMEGGLIDTPMTWDNYQSVIDEVLTMNAKTLAAARRKMVRTIWEQEPSFKDSQLDLALYLSATKTNHDLEAALRLMQKYDPSMICGLIDLLTSAEAKQTVQDEQTATKTVLELHDESTAELEDNIRKIDDINRMVRANMDKDKAEEDAREYERQYQELTEKLEGIRKQKTDLLKNADLPLPDLSVEDGEITYRGQKWDNMSSSEQLRVATAIVRKLNPNCGFVLLDKLEQMDRETLAEFGRWLEAEGLQAIGTRVSTGDECSIIIEDGYVKGEEHFLAGDAPVAQDAAQPVMQSATPIWKAGSF